METSGFVASRRDENDGRVRLVSRTPKGAAAADSAQRAIEALERRWRDEIGADQFDIMKQALRDLGRDSFRT